MTNMRLSVFGCLSTLLATSALGCGAADTGSDDGGSGGAADEPSAAGGTSSCTLTDTGAEHSGVKTGEFACSASYYYDGADAGIFSIDRARDTTTRSSVFLMFHGKPTSITETSPNLDTTTQEPNPLDATKLLTNKTGMICGTPDWGTTQQGHAVIGDNKFTLTLVGAPIRTSGNYYTAHGTFHADCAPISRTATGPVTMDVTF
jgi:hypothetical protein